MPGPYVINDPKLLETLPGAPAVIPPSDKAYGVQCVGLLKVYTGVGITAGWRQGAAVVGAKAPIAPGTAIATFNAQGRYANAAHGNHAAFFVRNVPGGIEVLEQHVPPDKNVIHLRTIRSRGHAHGVSPSDDADAYSVIQ